VLSDVTESVLYTFIFRFVIRHLCIMLLGICKFSASAVTFSVYFEILSKERVGSVGAPPSAVPYALFKCTPEGKRSNWLFSLLGTRGCRFDLITLCIWKIN